MNNSTKNWSMLKKIKKGIKKINFFINSSFKFNKLSLASISILRCTPTRRFSRRLSYGGEMGLYNGCYSDEMLSNRHDYCSKKLNSLRSFKRVKSICLNNDYGEDVDKKADLFIEKFHHQLQIERQISLQLRYCNHN
ncbi:hypothetical protein RND81_08G189300 [Saponaria officinalis]|uniref:Uncharacterized protein n=1 Tax=Saponaria officinalis TaxID=3572 RepID=A0AAW1JAE0_SAPOF